MRPTEDLFIEEASHISLPQEESPMFYTSCNSNKSLRVRATIYMPTK